MAWMKPHFTGTFKPLTGTQTCLILAHFYSLMLTTLKNPINLMKSAP